jgi:hypothetical protein
LVARICTPRVSKAAADEALGAPVKMSTPGVV